MGFFDFFKPKPVATAELLDEDHYWRIVAASLANTGREDDQEELLIAQLEKLTPKEIIGFRLRTDKSLYDTYTPEMWCAGYLMNGGCSDDGFEYFRNWVISRGRDVYYKAKANPDSLIAEADDSLDMYDFESFWYVALEAFQNKTGKDLYDYISQDFKFGEADYPTMTFNWRESDPESMRRLCPQLFERFGGWIS